MLPSLAFLLLWSLVRIHLTSPVVMKDEGYLLNESSTFHLPPGFLHVRVLAIGGGGAGCSEPAFARGKASVPKVKIIHVNGSVSISITVGKGGTKNRHGTSSRFGNYLEVKGGKSCNVDFTDFSLKNFKDMDRFRLSHITKGPNGEKGRTNYPFAAGGEGGILINGKGPTAFPGSRSDSGRGGKGYGAGGGSEVYRYNASLNRGGDGAPGVVYFEFSQERNPTVTSAITTSIIRPTTLFLNSSKVAAVTEERTATSAPKMKLPIQTNVTAVLPSSSSLLVLLKQTDQTSVEAGYVTTVTHGVQKIETIISTLEVHTFSSSTISPTVVDEPIQTEITQKKQMGDFQRILDFNISVVTIADIEVLKAFLALVEEYLSKKWEDGGIAKRLQVLKIVELVSMKLASQMSPDVVKGYSMLNIQSRTIALQICSVLVSSSEQLLLNETKDEKYMDQGEGVAIPTSIFSNLAKEEGVGHVMVLTYSPFDEMIEPNTATVRSRVMNMVAKPTTTMPFKKPVEIIFPVDEHLKEESRCMFWNTTKSKTAQPPYEWWDETGCRTIRVNGKRIACHCNHLTNFAVITRVKNYPRSKETERSLQIITYVGISLSLLGCVLTISTYAFLPSLWSDRTTINVQLVVAILISQTLFLASTFTQHNKTLCFAMAVVMYYFYLSVFTWMLVEGVHIYCKVVRVYQSSRIRKRMYFLFGWGIPAISTILSASIFRERFVSNKTCWLSIESGAVWTFVGLVVFVVLVNFVILCIVMRISTKAAKNDRNASSKALVKGFIALLPILGLTWVFGVLAVNSSTVVFEFIFASLNSMQGFLIFIFCCVINSEVQREFNRKLRNIRARRNPSFTPSQSGSCRHESHSSSKKLFQIKSCV